MPIKLTIKLCNGSKFTHSINALVNVMPGGGGGEEDGQSWNATNSLILSI